MGSYDGTKLRPLFYSEISSSYLIYEVFKEHHQLTKQFVRTFFGLDVERADIAVSREHMYRGKGAIDLLLVLKGGERPVHVLIEVKVHDYQSATPGQIRTYYEAALEETADTDVYFVYLTQFSRNNFDGNSHIATPPTIIEFEDSRRMQGYEQRIRHVNWQEFHDFIDFFRDSLRPEQLMMLDLQKTWITAECEIDKNENRIAVGVRSIRDYFPELDLDVEKELPFGETRPKNKRLVFSVDLASCNAEQYDQLFGLICRFLESSSVDKTVTRKTEEYTLTGAKEFLANLAQDESNWRMLSFYSSLFHRINSADHVFFNGTGSRGFSIKLGIKEKGEISLCTLWANKTIEFSLMR
jgi:hypothetical protein